MTIHVGLDVGRVGGDSTALIVIEQMDGKRRVIVSVDAADTAFLMQSGVDIASTIRSLLLPILRREGLTDEDET